MEVSQHMDDEKQPLAATDDITKQAAVTAVTEVASVKCNDDSSVSLKEVKTATAVSSPVMNMMKKGCSPSPPLVLIQTVDESQQIQENSTNKSNKVNFERIYLLFRS